MPSSYDGDIRLSVSLEPKDVIQSAQKLRGEIEKVFNKASGIKDVRLTKQLADLDKFAVKADQLSKNLEKARKTVSDFEVSKKLRDEYADIEKTLSTKYNPDFKDLTKLSGSEAREFDALTARYEELKQELKSFSAISEKEYKKAISDVEKYKNTLIEVNNQTRVGLVSADSRMTELNDKEAEQARKEEAQKLAEEAKEQERLAQEEALRTAELQRTTVELQRQVDLAREVVSAWTEKDSAGEWSTNIASDIKIVENALSSLIARQAELETTPYGIEGEEYSRITNQINELSGALANLKNEEQLGAEEIYEYMQAILATETPVARFKEKISELAHSFTQTLGTSIASTTRQFGALIASPVTGFFDKLKNKIKQTAKSSTGMELNFKKMGRMFLRYGLGLRSFFTLFRKLRSAVKEGITNLMQFNGGSNEVANTVNSLKASLTSLKNAWGAAFAPILQMIAPILQTLINMLVDAGNAVASFFAALGGQSKIIKATKAQKGLSSALEGTGSAAKEAKGQLASFDELNIIQNQNNGGGSGSGAGAGAGAGFEYANVDSNISNLVSQMKASWENNADFTWLGTLLGQKLKTALDTSYNFINSQISPFFVKLARSVATFLNGIIEVDGLADIIGKNIGAAFNAGFKLVNTFLKEFHWDSLGTFISQGIVSAFNEFDWGNVSEFLSLKIIAIMDAIRGAITGIDWKQLPRDIWKAIVEFVSKIDVTGLSESFGALVSAAVSGITNFFIGFGEMLSEAIGDIGDYFEPYIEDAKNSGKSIIEGVWQGILDGVKGFWRWLCNNVFNPFIEGWKKFFKIGSPSKLMAEIGANIIQGLLEGLKGLVDSVISFFSDLGAKIVGVWTTIKDKAKTTWNNIKTAILNVVGAIQTNVHNKFTAIGNFISTTWNTIKGGVSSAWNGIKTAVSTAIELVKTAISTKFTEISTKISSVWSSVSSFTSATWNSIKNSISTVITNIKTAISTKVEEIKTAISTKFDEIKRSISSVWTNIQNGVSGAWNGIKSAVSTAIETVKTSVSAKFDSIKTTIASVWSNIQSTAYTTWDTIKTKLKEKAEAVKEKVVTPFNQLRDSISTAFSTMWSNIKGTINSILYGVEGMANGVVKGMNKVIDSLNSIKIDIPAWIPIYGGKKFSLNLGKLNTIWIPKLAEGAVIPPNKEFIAMLGDQKSGTNIEAPLETIKDAVRDVVGNGNFDEEVVELLQELIRVVSSKNLTISKRDVGKAAMEYVRGEQKRTGNVPILG